MKAFHLKTILACVLTLACSLSRAQHTQSNDHTRASHFPDIPGYLTLKCDFHIHSVFSDGSVWPDIRVQEALRDSLDAISLTEHLEYQPHKDDIPHPDRNRAYELASELAKDQPLMIVNGSEITRSMPPGHANAIFIQDANPLLVDDSLYALDPLAPFKAAKDQGAFIFWNHPNWSAQYKDGIAKLAPMHRQLIDQGLLNGIEVVNDRTYSDEALQIALDHNLTIMGTSDIHGLVDWQYRIPQGGHRPITLVFAREKTENGIKEGLLNRRTVAWFNHTLIGLEEYLVPLIKASLQITKSEYQDDTFVAIVEMKNTTGVEYLLENQSVFSLHAHSGVVTLPPYGTTTVEVKTITRLSEFDLTFRVLNAVTAPKANPQIKFKITIP